MNATDDEVFDTGASPDLRSPQDRELRRSARTSSRKRSSTGSIPYARPKNKKKMSTMRSPPAERDPAPQEQTAPQANPFASLGNGQPVFMQQMESMMGGMLSGMENRLSRANGDLQANVTGQIDKAMASIGDLSTRISATKKRLDDVVVTVESLVEKKVEESLRKISPMDRGLYADGDFPCLPASAGSLTDGQMLSSSSSISTYATAASRFSSGITAAERKERDFWICRLSLIHI